MSARCRTEVMQLFKLVVIGAALILGACARTPQLTPAPGAEIVQLNGTAATASSAGVTVTAEASGWPGPVDIEDVVTPMRVTIENGSERAIRIRYSEFALVSEQGRRYAALPPYGVKGTVREPLMARRYRPIDPIGFDYRYFRVAPHYRSVYPSLSVYTADPFFFDPYYYSHYYPYWQRVRVELPTREMLRRALPEGVLAEGGRLEGFLYFERVEETRDAMPVRFHADLVDVATGRMFATIHIPFVADPGD